MGNTNTTESHDYFFCDACENRDFKVVFNFSLRFHRVNFSDDLIYDRITDRIYQCTQCSKQFTSEQIEGGLVSIKRKRKQAP